MNTDDQLIPLIEEAKTSDAALQLLLRIDRANRHIIQAQDGTWQLPPPKNARRNANLYSLLNHLLSSWNYDNYEELIKSPEIQEKMAEIYLVADICLEAVVRSSIKHDNMRSIACLIHNNPKTPHTDKIDDYFGTPAKILNSLKRTYPEEGGIYMHPFFKSDNKENKYKKNSEAISKLFGSNTQLFLETLGRITPSEEALKLTTKDIRSMILGISKDFGVLPTAVAKLMTRNDIVRELLESKNITYPREVSPNLASLLAPDDSRFMKSQEAVPTAEKQPNPSQADIAEYTDGHLGKNPRTSWRAPDDPEEPQKW